MPLLWAASSFAAATSRVRTQYLLLTIIENRRAQGGLTHSK